MKGFGYVTSDRKKMDFVPGIIKNAATSLFNYMAWGPKREMPEFAEKSFSQQYKDKNKTK